MQSIETSTQLFSQAATLMVVGMVFVFGFLSVMILVIKFLITPLAKRFPDHEPVVKKSNANQSKGHSAVVAAITVAVKQYRKNH
ncbi:MAG: OadG family protein, partial [Proteobacteria bacterium]|nr:OadG family protein [Pseudomonadota bacterium]